MHIAICDDNIADRKHTERLLGREADKRRNDVRALYIDSFGHVDALLRAPMIYDVFFIDYHSDELSGIKLAEKLRHAGVMAPIYICAHTPDGESNPAITPIKVETDHISWGMELYEIFKPLQPSSLCKALDYAASLIGTRETPLEIRSKDATHYITKKELCYIDTRKTDMVLYRTDGSTTHLINTFRELWHSFENHSEFICIGHSFIVNTMHIKQVTMTKIIFIGGGSLRIPLFQSGKTRKAIKKAKEDGIQ